MIKGLTVPRSPLGLATIAPRPPWHISADVVGIEYWADPAATAALLPEGLTPDPVSNGHVVIFFADCQFTSRNEEHADPARYQYREALILVDAQWRDTPVTYCPLIYVDNDVAMARGWLMGLPSRFGSVFQTRTFAAASPATAPLAAGGHFAASLSAHGVRLAEASVTLEAQVDDPISVFATRPPVLLRYFPRLERDKRDTPAVNELTLLQTDNLHIVDLWVGEAKLRIPESKGEHLHALAPIHVGSGFRFGLAHTITDLRILEDLTVRAEPDPR